MINSRLFLVKGEQHQSFALPTSQVVLQAVATIAAAGKCISVRGRIVSGARPTLRQLRPSSHLRVGRPITLRNPDSQPNATRLSDARAVAQITVFNCELIGNPNKPLMTCQTILLFLIPSACYKVAVSRIRL
ncbi:hypothetical protein EVAR_95728_1 [Eumeta japonica]|uniref:Uncharacterized protein n=1 Tax=Eumeta variegata TaxID=151549 RepID=A0A4C1ULU0_EUMVA|nr:hypothetical protein EVAR_95728_1 [Eumeta japonica]